MSNEHNLAGWCEVLVNLLRSPEPGLATWCAAVNATIERIRESLPSVAPASGLDLEAAEELSDAGQAGRIDHEASVRVLNSILQARVPEEAYLRDYDDDPTTAPASTPQAVDLEAIAAWHARAKVSPGAVTHLIETDIPALLSEVERLRLENVQLNNTIDTIAGLKDVREGRTLQLDDVRATLKAGPQEGSWEWALAQMKAGKAVTRQNAGRMCFRGDGLLSHKLHRSYLEATDWQIVAEPASTEGE